MSKKKLRKQWKNRAQYARWTRRSPIRIHVRERSVERSINYESNGVWCIIEPGRGLERRGNGTDRPGTERRRRAWRRGYKEGERRESNLNRNSDRYLWKLTEFEVNRARATETLVSHEVIHSVTKVHVHRICSYLILNLSNKLKKKKKKKHLHSRLWIDRGITLNLLGTSTYFQWKKFSERNCISKKLHNLWFVQCHEGWRPLLVPTQFNLQDINTYFFFIVSWKCNNSFRKRQHVISFFSNISYLKIKQVCLLSRRNIAKAKSFWYSKLNT